MSLVGINSDNDGFQTDFYIVYFIAFDIWIFFLFQIFRYELGPKFTNSHHLHFENRLSITNNQSQFVSICNADSFQTIDYW